MRKFIQRILMGTFALALVATQVDAQTTLVHYWNFNTFNSTEYTDTIQPVAADYTLITDRTASILYTQMPGTSADYSSYVDPYPTVDADYDTVNLRMNDTGGISLRARNPSDSMELLFYIPTTNYQNIMLMFATESSSTNSGQTNQIYDYSLDSGATWKTSGINMASYAAPTTFGLSVIMFTDDSANNNSRLIFRLRFDGNNTGNKGNNRFDNITVDADTLSVTDTSTNAVKSINPASMQYVAYPNPVTDRINIAGTADENTTVAVYNTAGQAVFMGMQNGKNISVNTAAFSAGNYFIVLRGNKTGNTQTLKFVKQ